MRSDLHRPTVFDPTDYETREAWDTTPPPPTLVFMFGIAFTEAYEAAKIQHQMYLDEMRAEFGGRIPHQCQHCGAHFRYCWSVEHTPTGEVIAMGEECVANRLGITRSAFRMKFIQDKASRDAAEAAKIAKRNAWEAANVEVATFLGSLPENESFEFLLDLRSKLGQYGDLSERQTAAALKIKVGREAKAVTRQAEAAIAATSGPAPEGTATVAGLVLSTKSYESDFGSTLKMLVKLDDGNKVFGTVPSGAYDGLRYGGHYQATLKGQRIEFTGTFSRSSTDEHFSTFKRPRAATVTLISVENPEALAQ